MGGEWEEWREGGVGKRGGGEGGGAVALHLYGAVIKVVRRACILRIATMVGWVGGWEYTCMLESLRVGRRGKGEGVEEGDMEV